MLEFKPYSITELKKALPYIKKTTSLCSELSAGSLFMWQEGTELTFCVWNDTLVISQKIGEQPAFSWPMGKDINGMVDELIKYVRENHLALRFYEIDDPILKIIKADKRLQPSMSQYEDRWSDYIYSAEDVLTFSGKKYKGQRNHINKFKRLYGEPRVRFITEDDREDLKRFLSDYRKEHTGATDFEYYEIEKCEELLDIYKDFGMYAACLVLDGRIAAISIGEVIGDSLLIHIEKALRVYDGIYPTMYQSFVKLVMDTGNKFTLVNREDDSGDEGIRTSKMQYQPVGRVNKYLVHINSPAARIKEMPVLSGGAVLTAFRESDKPAYLKLNIDIENNRYWGYDYREDEDIIGEIDESTFYDFTLLDMRAGDSVNFAVRESVNGEMIGEALIWNFTADGTGELGCRIMPGYQGKGYGKAAFGALADFAANTLKIKITARCFKENGTSYRMITGNGFRETHRDGTYIYFSR